MNGIIVINKEKEYTSFDVVAVARKVLKEKKIGHTGTLDPNATGVLVLLLGNATKAQDIIPNHDKEYIAEFKFGLKTDTLDIWGNVLEEKESKVKTNEILATLDDFRGKIMQTPPMYSSIVVNGRRLYDYARKGEEVERVAREREIYKLELLDFDEEKQEGTFIVNCSKGTYIRSLIDDIANKLNTIGVMTNLNRIMACTYTIDNSISLSQLKDLTEKGEIENYILPTESLFYSYEEIVVSDAQAHRFKNGNPLSLDRLRGLDTIEDKKIYRVKDKDNNFISLGIIDIDSQMLKMYKHF